MAALAVPAAQLPAGVDAAMRELSLDDGAFVAAFGCDKVKWAAKPKWQKDAKKKELGLF